MNRKKTSSLILSFLLIFQVVAQASDKKILVVEAHDDVRGLIVHNLEKIFPGVEVLQAKSTTEAIKLFEKHGDNIELVSSNYLMPPSETGLDLARRIRKTNPSVPFILFSGELPDDAEAKKAGVSASVPKPNFEKFREAVTKLVKGSKCKFLIERMAK